MQSHMCTQHLMTQSHCETHLHSKCSFFHLHLKFAVIFLNVETRIFPPRVWTWWAWITLYLWDFQQPNTLFFFLFVNISFYNFTSCFYLLWKCLPMHIKNILIEFYLFFFRIESISNTECMLYTSVFILYRLIAQQIIEFSHLTHTQNLLRKLHSYVRSSNETSKFYFGTIKPEKKKGNVEIKRKLKYLTIKAHKLRNFMITCQRKNTSHARTRARSTSISL